MDNAILSEELVEIWAQGYPTLSYLKLWAAQTGHEIASQAWKNLRATNPSLLVEILVQKFESTAQMLPALSPAMPVCKLLWESESEDTSDFQLTSLLHRVASYEKTIKSLFVKIHGENVTLDTLSVQILLSNCRKLLPFKCKNFTYPSTESDTWILSQDSGSRPQEDI
ncbi:unnamed protein product [Lymnaea stagnalis]|uniref:Uncharacterized protein n=1 Tax=Lymnaea stagnalis TaxID=6523 RepID=A0AAV2HL95_LYMST